MNGTNNTTTGAPGTGADETTFRETAEQHANRCALANAALKNAFSVMEQSLSGIKDAHRGPIGKAAAALRQSIEDLYALVQANPDEFQRPRSMEFNGVKFGMRKGTGSMVLATKEETIIARIRLAAEKLRASESTEAHAAAGKLEGCISTRESLNKGALADLDASTLKKLGITIEGTGDKVFVTIPDSVEKQAAELLAGVTTAG